MKTKNILIFGSLLALGVIGYIVLNKKSKPKKETNLGTARISTFTKPTSVTATIRPEILASNL